MIKCFIRVQTLSRSSTSAFDISDRWEPPSVSWGPDPMTRGSVPATLNLLHRPRCIYICFPFIRETHNEHPRGVCECVRVRDGLTWRDQGADDDKETVLWDLSVCEEQDCGNVFYPRLHVQSGQIHLGALQERLLLKHTIWTAYHMWPLLSSLDLEFIFNHSFHDDFILWHGFTQIKITFELNVLDIMTGWFCVENSRSVTTVDVSGLSMCSRPVRDLISKLTHDIFSWHLSNSALNKN